MTTVHMFYCYSPPNLGHDSGPNEHDTSYDAEHNNRPTHIASSSILLPYVMSKSGRLLMKRWNTE